MFVCKECTTQLEINPFKIFRSRSRCGMCGHVRDCLDLPSGSYAVKRDVPEKSEAIVKIDFGGCKGLAISVEIPKKYCTGLAMDGEKYLDEFDCGLVWDGDEYSRNNVLGPVRASRDNTMRITIRQKPE